jgi:hypothetical protein
MFTAEHRAAHEPSLYFHKHKTSRYFVHLVTATGVTYIIIITVRSPKYVSELLWIELTAWIRVILEKLTVIHLVKNSMENEGSLPHSQVSAPVAILSQLDPLHTPTFYFPKIHLNIILPSTPGSPNWFFPSGFPTKPCIRLSFPHARYMPHPSHSSHFITRTIFGEQYRSLSSSLCSFLHSSVMESSVI